MKKRPQKPHRLDSVFACYDPPLYFITFCTMHRNPVLNTPAVHEKFIVFAQNAERHGVAFGRYVIMPDHIHCFIRIAAGLKVGTTVRLLKRALSSAIGEPTPHWQPDFLRLYNVVTFSARFSDGFSKDWKIRFGKFQALEKRGN